ncbi:MAG: fumarylacetoacetase [Chitinophagales bacterium]
MTNANDPALKSWVDVSPQSDFPIQNLPFGIFKTNHKSPRAATAIGDYVLDLTVVAALGLFDDLHFDTSVFEAPTLNRFIALGKPVTNAVRERLSELLRHGAEAEKELRPLLIKQTEVQLLLPVHIPNYTDFYSSREHATNVGMMFRDPANALLPNWLHLPVGYHGRASSIVVSGTAIHRPKGQTKADDQTAPTFGPSRLVDFELEMAFVVGKGTALGESIATAQAEEYIFGMLLFNDWSARDIQKWEYVPLGPFLAKNFGSTVSPWIVTMEALEPFRCASPQQSPEVLPYLKFEGDRNFDIQLQVEIEPQGVAPKIVSQSNFKYMYWNMAQQLAHHTVNGCNVEVGDLYASGTISGPSPDSYGSMLEISWQGKKPVSMPDGSERRFIQDNDTVNMRAWCAKNGVRIGFGPCSGKILPAI